MYKCCNCERKFEEPRTKETTYENFYGVSMQSHTYLLLELCPYCGSDEIEERNEDEDY